MDAEAIQIQPEDRPAGRGAGSALHTMQRVRPRTNAPEDWARLMVSVPVVPIAGGDDWRVRVGRHLGDLEVAPIRTHRVTGAYYLTGFDVRERLPDQDSEKLRIYRAALRRLRSERRDQDDHSRRRQEASAYLEESIALAHPMAFRLLGSLHYAGEFELEEVFSEFGSSEATFEGVARLHLIGAIKFANGKLHITFLGTRILRAFGLIGELEEEESRVTTEGAS